MTWLALLAGLLILGLLTWDVYSTVFVPHGFAGPIMSHLYRATWKLSRRFSEGPAGRVPRRPGKLGPLLVLFTYVVWSFLLWAGFAFTLYPWADQFTLGGNQAGPGRWVSAWYVSGYSITTLGVGDIHPQGAAAWLLLVVGAGSGFVLVTVAVTYLLSVYGALARANALAYQIHRLVGRDQHEGPLDVVVRLARSHRHVAGNIGEALAGFNATLAQVVQAQGQYPLLVYFQPPADRALPQALADLLEIITVLRNLLARDEFPAVRDDVLMLNASRLALGYFESLRVHLRADRTPPADPTPLDEARLAAFERAWLKLLEAGVPLASHREAWQGYQQERRQWDALSAHLTALLGHATPTLPGE